MDGCSRQNPAYRPAKEKPRSGGVFLSDDWPATPRAGVSSRLADQLPQAYSPVAQTLDRRLKAGQTALHGRWPERLRDFS